MSFLNLSYSLGAPLPTPHENLLLNLTPNTMLQTSMYKIEKKNKKKTKKQKKPVTSFELCLGTFWCEWIC